jgi:hypothetical protein
MKARMKKLDVEWSEEIRAFIEERVNHLELVKTMEEVGSRAAKRKVKGDSTVLIRQERDR